jgi:hypothetical protein
VFTSRSDLTHEGVTPGVAQVFQYDAQTGSLVRASIGEAGFDDDGRAPAYGASLATQQADAFDSPTSAVGVSAPANGAVFFESPTALTPRALEDMVDGLGQPVPNVYEYRAGGVSLISDGRDDSTVNEGPGVRLLGADPSGAGAFFTTVDPLVAQDTDTQQDIYDARGEGGFPAPQPAPGCVGEACQGPLIGSLALTSTLTPTLPLEGGVGATTATAPPPARAGATLSSGLAGDTAAADPVPFGIADFAMRALGADDAPDTQAGGHPESLTASFDLTTSSQDGADGLTYQLTEDVKDIVLNLPTGLAVSPQAAPRCALYELQLTFGETECPATSRIGTLVLRRIGEGETTIQESEPIAVYNMVPEVGYPLELGASYLGTPILMYGSVVHTESGYGLRLAVPGIQRLGLTGASLTLFGDPTVQDGTASPPDAFFTNPVDCGRGSLPARLEVDSWQHPGQYRALETVAYNDVTGCAAPQFQPALSVTPETTQASERAGYDFEIRVPQRQDPAEPATAELKSATLTLPVGVSIAPAAADGLVGCPATGPEGINVGSDETGPAGQDLGDPAASELGPDGLYHSAPGRCPEAATVGTVEITTPLLPEPLYGQVFVGCGGEDEASCAEPDPLGGRQIGVYLQAAGSGVIVKLAGTVIVDEATDQLTVAFDELPQLQFSELTLRLKGGPRAVLANPEACGTATTTSQFAAWSWPGTPFATASSAFGVTGCPSLPPPPAQPAPALPSGTAGTPATGSPTPPGALGQTTPPPPGGAGHGVKSLVTTKPPKKGGKARHKAQKRKHRRGGKLKQKHGKNKSREARPKQGDR